MTENDISNEEYKDRLKQEIIDIVERCYNCTFCSIECPLDRVRPGFCTSTPSGLLQSIYYAVRWDLFNNEHKEDLLDMLSACTTCNSCVLACKNSSTGIPVLDAIHMAKELLVIDSIGPLPGHRDVLQSIFLRDNPYEKDQSNRLQWVDGLDVKRYPEEKAEILYYIGCTPAFDASLHNVPRSMVKIMQRLKKDFVILEEEPCCSCVSKRLGDEFLMQEKAAENFKMFEDAGSKEVITTSPHCYNAFVNDYPKTDSFSLLHYTQYLNKHVSELNLSKPLNRIVTYHDPCYLGKHNSIYEEPRNLIKAVPGVKYVEMKENRDKALCCGGGGGRMWIEVKEEQRSSHIRINSALEIGVDLIAVACPWCHTMLRDAISELGVEDKIEVKDLAEILAESL